MVITQATADRVVGTMPIAGNHGADGALHPGAACVLAESLGSTGAWLHATSVDRRRIVVGVDISATHHRPARGTAVSGVAVPLSLHGPHITYGISIVDDAGALVCTARLTCLVSGGP